MHCASEIEPSARGELEITDVNVKYLNAGKLHVEQMGRGFAWLDMGTSPSLLEASEFVAVLERRQGLKVSCPEKIALRLGYATLAELEPWLVKLGQSGYGDYILSCRHAVLATGCHYSTSFASVSRWQALVSPQA